MTINELEQAIRNLMASQPNLSSDTNSNVINSALSMINSYREFAYKIQNHPQQDVLKINMTNQCISLESALVISVCQVMQEKGINLMLYAPTSNYSANSFSNQTINSNKTESSNINKVSEAIQSHSDYDDFSKVFSDEEPEEEEEVVGSEIDSDNEEAELKEQESFQNAEINETPINQSKLKPEDKIEKEEPKPVTPSTKSTGRDYLLELLKK